MTTRKSTRSPRQGATTTKRALRRVLGTLTQATTVDEVAAAIAAEARGTLGMGGAALWILERRGNTLHLIACNGISPEALAELQVLPLNAPAIAAQAAQTGKPIEVQDILAAGDALAVTRRIAEREGQRSVLAQPLIARRHLIGVLILVTPTPRRLTRAERDFLRTVADLGAMVVDDMLRVREADEARQRVADILNSVSDGFYTLDREWRFTYLNPAAEEFFRRVLGKDPEELLGHNIWQVIPELVGTKFEREFRRATNERSTVAFEELYSPGNVWLDLHVYPSPGGLSVYFQDVTKRTIAEEERVRLLEQAQAAEARYRALFEGTADAILVADAHARYVDANRAASALLGYSREELLHMGIADVAASGRLWTEVEFNRFLQAGYWQGELELRRKDGTLVPVEARATRVEVPGGTSYVSVLRDVTERRRAEEERARLLHELNAQRAWLQTVIERSPVGILVVEGTGGERVIANREAENLFGRPLPPEGGVAQYVGQVLRPNGAPLARSQLAVERALHGQIATKEEEL